MAKTDKKIRFIQLHKGTLFIDGDRYDNARLLNFRLIKKLKMLTDSDCLKLKTNLNILVENQITSVSDTHFGFIMFDYQPVRGMDYYDIRHITIDNGHLNLSEFGFKKFDEVEDIVLFGNK